MTDSQRLLEEYVTSGSEPAFRGLLTRYVDLVYSAAVRLVNGDAHLAKDVTQTVFVDLARMARTLSPQVMLGGWLHRHTCYVAATLRRSERRRQAREKQAVEMNALQEPSEPNWAEARPILDEAINQLGNDDRKAILLRFFEQSDFRTVAGALGSTEEAAKKRVSRALAKLHELLVARGVTLSATALAAVLTAQGVTAAPQGLVSRIAEVALAGAALTHGTTISLLKVMTTSKLTIGLTAALAAGLTLSIRQHQAQTKLLEANSALRQQVEQLAADSNRLSDRLMQANTPPAETNNQVRELMRLRGEVGVLQRQLADAARARERTVPRPQAAADSQEQQQRQMAIGKMRDATVWILAFHKYAAEHQSQFPTDFDQVTSYLDGALRSNLQPGELLRDKQDFAQSTNQFEIVYQGSIEEITNRAATIVMREKEAWAAPNGGWSRTYGFADGHTEIHKAEDGDFGPWESKHLQAAAAQ